MEVKSTPLSIISTNSDYLQTKRIIDVIFTLLIFIPLCVIMAIVAVAFGWTPKAPSYFASSVSD